VGVLSQAEGSSEPYQQKLSPPVKDVGSDKKFFGPPFPADYPEDKRPVISSKVLNKLKGPSQPYPALQSKDDYDTDFVKDENSDTGAWQAQFEYDALRKKLAQEEADARRAEGRYGRDGQDVDDAQRDADAAAQRLRDAEKDAKDAEDQESNIKRAEDFDGPPSHEKLDELKKAIDDAEHRYEKNKKDFEECKRQLEEAKAHLEDLKAKHAEMEKQLAEETKLWVEQKTAKLNLKKSKQVEASSARKAAEERVLKAEKTKAEMEKALAKEKAEHDEAEKKHEKAQKKMDKAKDDLEKAALRLQKLHGYKPAPEPLAKNGAPTTSALLSLSMIVAMRIF